ncbi:hypothetical protein TRFO_33095 [Tritrichomonas foetus]|uniref:Uncharacterized protein n=1 Tax=Tritrichomonas foetus TaxID=1144522 RepID=A0A1J4JMC6_9EUKA|nr:hypothetical protein TRFO_33095 [Tritrichomonas foetus]|eukprot:OHT00265.1 hypothetical protein TRFO_33095 [Tritrichomonas foetus]
MTEPFITSLVNNNDIVPLLTHSNIKNLLTSMVPPEAQDNLLMASMMVGQMVQQLIVGILASRGVNDPTVINSVRSIVPSIVEQLLQSSGTNQKELFLPGNVFQVVATGPDTYQVVKFVEGKPLPQLLMIMMGVQDHNLQLLINALKILANPPQPAQQGEGPRTVDDLD